MNFSSSIVRQFLEGVEWVTARNVDVLFNGKYLPEKLKYTQNKLYAMTETKRIAPLKMIHNDWHSAFCLSDCKRKDLPKNRFHHDNRLRDVIACLYYLNSGSLQISNNKNADFLFDDFYIEYDAGTKSPESLEEQVRRYCNREPGRVIYIMASRYSDEKARLEILFEILSRLAKDVPNKILANTYTDFLNKKILYNFKGQEIPLLSQN